MVRRGRAAVRRARRGGRGPDRRPSQQRVPVPGGAARAAHPAAERRPREARTAPVAPPDRGDARPGRRTATPLHTSRCIRCDRVDGFPCLVDAQGRRADRVRRPRARAPEPRPRHQRQGRAARDRRHRTHRSPRWSRRWPTARRRGSRATWSSSSCGALNSALLLLRSANDAHPNGLANGSDQVGRNYMRHNNVAMMALSEGAEPDAVPEDARAQRLVPQGRGHRLPVGRHPDARQVRRRAAEGQGAALPRVGDEARCRIGRSTWSPTTASTSGCRPRTCPHPDNRVTIDEGRRRSRSASSRRTPKGSSGSQEVRVDAHRPRDARRPARAQAVLPRGDGHLRDRAPGRHGPVRDRSGDLGARRRTARRTSSTTSTSSTRASSRRSAR